MTNEHADKLIIRANDLTRTYGDLTVLKDISLSIQGGEIVTITGKSGAGKSTLLHILGTLDTPDSGQLILNGNNPFNYSSTQLSKYRNGHIGFVFQFHHLLAEFDALENVLIPARIAQSDIAEAKARAEHLLEMMDMQDRMDHKPSELSGGEQQRIAMARALINNPTIVLADEPSGNLDTQTSYDLHQLILTLRKEFNQTFVLVTHNLKLAQLSDRTINLVDGEVEGISQT